MTRAVAARLSILALGLPAVASPLAGQELVPRAVPEQRVEAFSFASDLMGRTYTITVGYPEGWEAEPGRHYPALLLTDGDQTFPLAHPIAEGLLGQGTIEPLLVISVSTPIEAGEALWVRRRVYEFSPPDWDMEDPFGEAVLAACAQYGSPSGECTGGAPRFLRFLATELLPVLEAELPIDPERLGLFGVSAGGFFAAWTMFQPESPFRSYIISSPAMAYGDDEIFRQEAHLAETRDDLPIDVYIGSGALEADDPFLEARGRIVSGHVHLAALLRSRGYPGLTLFSEIHPGLGHIDAAPTTLARGLRLLYPR